MVFRLSLPLPAVLTSPDFVFTNPYQIPYPMTHYLLTLLAIPMLFSCAGSVDQPQGTSKGYSSARLIQPNPNALPISDPTQRSIHRMIQSSIKRGFTSNGLQYGTSGADLVVAYLVIYQEPGMTASFPEYFGYGRDAEEISDYAHVRGVLGNRRPDYFRQAGIVVDVIDTHTNKLVFRGFAKGDVVKSAGDADRRQRIDTAIDDAVKPFFR